MSVPRKFAISDIHGCNETFGALLEQIDFSTNDELYILGDLIDRGPNSKGVFDRIFRLQTEGHNITCLRGNHEQLFLDAYQGDILQAELWLENGGVQTLRSFAVETPAEVPDKYHSFIFDLPYFVELEDYILVHAGLNLKRYLPLMDPKSMLWIRHWYTDFEHNKAVEWLNNRVIVHGHSPISRATTADMLLHSAQLPVLNIDNGCVFAGKRKDLGDLCAFDLTNRILYWNQMEG
jgi:serine/threonine protein phosphatase 1